jgi:hypothetical protein
MFNDFVAPVSIFDAPYRAEPSEIIVVESPSAHQEHSTGVAW